MYVFFYVVYINFIIQKYVFQERKPLRLSCAIVDDADHVLELETLLPLRFGVDKIALFGGCKDEKSSSLIKSAVAKRCGFGSFFERIRKRHQT